MRYIKIIPFLFSLFTIAWLSCNKPAGNDDPSGPYNLSYGSSVIYLRPQAGDYIVHPTQHRPGIYSGFPEGIEIDDNTGAINVSDSETGLRYKITHTAPDGTETSTLVVLSGISFTDKFYILSQNDTIAKPVYNANPSEPLPIAGSIFDEGGIANSSGCDVKTFNGQINLAQTIRNGIFGSNPSNDDKEDIEIVYRLNDGSGKAVNKLKVRLYYYTSMATVTDEMFETLQEREEQGVFLGASATGMNSGGSNTMRPTQIAKPRPPCIIIVGQ